MCWIHRIGMLVLLLFVAAALPGCPARTGLPDADAEDEVLDTDMADGDDTSTDMTDLADEAEDVAMDVEMDVPAGSENTDAACSDGVDNDSNGFTDCDDFSCSRNANVSICGTESNDTLCSDGVDNDDNGFTDCDDFACSQNQGVTVCGEVPDCVNDDPSTCLDDGEECNGVATCQNETCGTSAPPAAGSPCTTSDGQEGTCQPAGDDQACVPAGCGNGVVDEGEDCDDNNTVDGDGCDADCHWTCTTDEECQTADGNLCNGDETCDLGSHLCQSGMALDCDDTNPCTTDSCDMLSGCSNVLIDNDGDGQAPSSLGACGLDCDDNDAQKFDGNSEVCNDGKDNDCNGTIDDGITTWWVDCDGDGYAVSGATSVMDCMEPSSGLTGCNGVWTTRNPASGADCDDTRAAVYPGAAEVTGNNRDDNCDGRERCYRDSDNDGYRTSGTFTSSDADCNDSGEAPASASSGDCCDSDGRVHPGQTSYFDAQDGGNQCNAGWDFNCDGNSTKRWSATWNLADCPVVPSCSGGAQRWGRDPNGGGWAGCAYYPNGSSGPPCGDPVAWCSVEKCGSGGSCQYQYHTRVQQCH